MGYVYANYIDFLYEDLKDMGYDLPVENSFRSHQVPLIVDKDHLENIKELEKCLKSYHPVELFNEDGSIKEDLKSLRPDEKHLMGLNPNTNGGLLL